jgi:hypothetical protein
LPRRKCACRSTSRPWRRAARAMTSFTRR